MGLFHDHSAKEAINLLCIDDDPATCRLYGEYGHILDWITDQALTIETAIEKVSQAKFDAIVVDQSMDSLSGIELIQRIRSQEGPNQDTPFLLCTIYSIEEVAAELNRLNVEAYVQNPISLARFEQAVLNLLDERSFTA